MIWHTNMQNIDENKEETLYSMNKSFFLFIKILNAYPLFFEMNIKNLIQVLNGYYEEKNIQSSSVKLPKKLDCKY